MSRLVCAVLVVVALVFSVSAVAMAQDRAPAQDRSPDPTELGRLYTTWLYEGQFDQLWPRFSAELTMHIGGEQGLRSFRDEVQSKLGAEARLVSERVERIGRVSAYTRIVGFEKISNMFRVTWLFTDDGTVANFGITPVGEQGAAPSPAPTRFADYRTKTPLRLPFHGEWFVFWGGRTIEENYHSVATDQRFAYDLVVVRDGRTHTGDGTLNEQYHCFGLEILAPGDGVVVVAHDGLPDNRPGVMDPANPPGNHLVLDHGNGEYSFLAHLQQGSVRVAVGERVAAGAVLGLCGNSGHSSEPHLHYHLQTTPDFAAGEGLPAQFMDYDANGKPVGRGEPTRGQVVRPAGGR
jgi:hypothetical protein